jgi:hypothetical protein
MRFIAAKARAPESRFILSKVNYPAASYGVSKKDVMPVDTGIQHGFPLARE